MLQDLMIGYIHNENNRSKIIKQRIEVITESLSLDREKCCIQSFYQNKEVKLNFRTFVLKAVLTNFCLSMWNYRSLKNSEKKTKIFLLTLKDIVLKIFITFSNILNYQKLKTKFYSEICLTTKHIDCWRRFANTRKKYLVIFEDDMAIKDKSLVRFSSFIPGIINAPRKNIFIDLAGGFNLEKGDYFRFDKTKDIEYVQLNRAQTNTTCGYLLDKELAMNLLDFINVNPIHRLLPIDWCMNVFFMGNNKSITCIHFLEPLFEHGSFVKKVRSSIQIEK